MDKHEKAWRCWLEITRKLGESGCYVEDGNLCLSGQYVGGDFVEIIEQYIS